MGGIVVVWGAVLVVTEPIEEVDASPGAVVVASP